MCGITGQYRWRSSASVQLASDLIAHRGPDGSGIWTSDTTEDAATLAHRRLAIIDLSDDAAQPMTRGDITIVFNGEIYNYKELRAELAGLGTRFSTTSDTEVLLEAWRQWGTRSLKKLRGMFAFAVYDAGNRTLSCVRDHFGIKPLFVAEKDGGVAFCSELKGLRSMLESGDINSTAIVASLAYVWIPESMCAIEGVEKLEAGTVRHYRPDGTRTIERWWDPIEELADLPPATIDELREALVASVDAHLVSDVPVATFLSGGLDSSLLTVLAARRSADLEAYTINFRESDKRVEAMPDDFSYAVQVAESHGIKLNEIMLEPDIANELSSLAYSLDEPIGDAAALNTQLICNGAREAGAKVLLSGMGADELFGGYRRHLATLLAGRYQSIPAVMRRGIDRVMDHAPVAIGNRGIRTTRWAKRFLTLANLPEEHAYRRSYTYYDETQLGALLGPGREAEIAAVFDDHRRIYDSAPFEDPVNRMCFADLKLFLPGLNLTVSDRASMSASTEVRVPFVDIDLVRMAFRFSGAQKIDGRVQKAVLKKAAESILPDNIIYRPKAPFTAPLRSWIGRDLKEMVEDVLPCGYLVSDGYLEKKAVRELIDSNRAGVTDGAQQIWHLLVLETWLDQHIGASPVSPAL